MKKIFKVFSLIFLIFITMTSCLAVNDYRFIINPVLIETLKRQINYSALKREHGSEEELFIDYASIIFVLNDKNIDVVTSAAPVLNNKYKTIGEVVIEFKIENVKKTEDVFSCLIMNLHNELFVPRIFKISFNFFESSKINPYRYVSFKRMFEFLKSHNIDTRLDDKIFYTASSDGLPINFDNLHIIHETVEGVRKKFVFQKAGGIKLVKQTSPSDQKNPIQRLIDCLFSCYPKKKCGYVKLSDSPPRSLFEFDKAKSE